MAVCVVPVTSGPHCAKSSFMSLKVESQNINTTISLPQPELPQAEAFRGVLEDGITSGLRTVSRIVARVSPRSFLDAKCASERTYAHEMTERTTPRSRKRGVHDKISERPSRQVHPSPYLTSLHAHHRRNCRFRRSSRVRAPNTVQILQALSGLSRPHCQVPPLEA